MELTEEERRRLSRPSFRMSGAGGRRPQGPLSTGLQGSGEAAATIGSAVLGSVPAGLAGLASLPFKGPQGAARAVEDVQEALTYVPRTQEGVKAVQGAVGPLSAMGAPAEYIGEKTRQAMGSPALATLAEVVLDPLNLIGSAVAGKAAASGARAVGRGAQVAARELGPKAAEMAEGYMRRAGMMPQIFIGKSAKTWDAASNARAAEMEAAGIPPQTIWRETGNWRAPDGQWRQEISDAAADFKADDDWAILQGPLFRVLEHKELQSAYPGLAKIQVEAIADSPQAHGSFSDAFGKRIDVAGPDLESKKNVLLHEIQHPIQEKEGFAAGANPNMFESIYEQTQKQRNAFNVFANLVEKYGDEVIRPSDLGRFDDVYEFIDAYLPAVNINRRLSKQDFEDFKSAVKSIGLKPPTSQKYGIGAYAEIIADNLRAETEKKFILREEQYFKQMGEAEARAVQARMNLTPEERRAKFPEESYDVPIGELLKGPKTRGSALSMEAKLQTTPAIIFDDTLMEAAVRDSSGATGLIDNALQTDAQGVIRGRPKQLDRDLARGLYTESDVQKSFASTLDQIRSRFGDTVKLWRADAPVGERNPDTRTVFMADEATARQYEKGGREAKPYIVNTDDILGVYARPSGYREVIVRSSALNERRLPREKDMAKAGGGAVEGVNMSFAGAADEIARKLVRQGMSQDQALMLALRMSGARMKAGGAVMMAGGGLLKGAARAAERAAEKGARAAEAAQKAAALSPIERSAQDVVQRLKQADKAISVTPATVQRMIGQKAEQFAKDNPRLTEEAVLARAQRETERQLQWERQTRPELQKRYGPLSPSQYDQPAPRRLRNLPAAVEQRASKAQGFLSKPTPPWEPPKAELQAFDRNLIKDALEGFPGIDQTRFPRYEAPRAQTGYIDEIYDDPRNRELIKQQIKRGLPLGGETFYASLYPVKVAAMERGIPAEKFDRFVYETAPASARNSIMNEMAVGQFMRDMKARGLPLDEDTVKEEMARFKQRYGTGLPLMPVHREGVRTMVESGANMRDMLKADIPTNYKIPTYGTQKAGDFGKSMVLDVHEAAGQTQGSRFHPYFTEQGGFGPTEYGLAEGKMLDIAKELGVPGGMAQAGRWFGGGELTGLKSPRGDALDLLEKQTAYTLQGQGINPTPKAVRDYILKMVETGEGVLMPYFKSSPMPDVRTMKAEGGEVKAPLSAMAR